MVYEKKDQYTTGTKIKTKQSVGQYDLNGNLIATYESYIAAARALGKSDSTAIRKVCKNQMPTAYGYVWKRI